MAVKFVVPLLEAAVPEGLRYEGNYLVEFEPDSVWYEASITIAARSVQRGQKTEYHSFHRDINDVKEALEALGLSVDKEVKKGMLRLIDSYTPATKDVKGRLREKTDFLANIAPNIRDWSKVIKKQTVDGFEDRERKWLHIDDNTSLLLQTNDEETMLNGWRTVFIPWGRARRLITINGFVKGVASDTFYRKNESLYDGVFELAAEEKEGRLIHRMRAKIFHGGSFDSSWKALHLLPRGEVVVSKKKESRETRKLAAVMVTDMVGYSEMMRNNEKATLALLESYESIIRPTILRHEGNIVKGTGDGFLVEFGSALAASECAVAIQQRMRRVKRGKGIRISIHTGDVVHKGGDIFGDAVNVASRLQAFARPGGICASRQVYEQSSGKMRSMMQNIGFRKLKNMSPAVEVYELGIG